MSETNEPKILYFDIETSPLLVYAWGLGKQYVGAKQVRKERKILSIGYMFETDKNVTILKMDMKKHDINTFDDDADKEMLIKFMKVYDTADLAVAHNGRRFDRARIRARLVKYRLPDIAPVLFDDSYGMTKDIDFTSHKLDYLGRYLGTGQKDEIDYSAWIRVMEGSKKALDEMCAYMKTDVIRLKDAYIRLKPYSKSKLNLSTFKSDGSICPGCGSYDLSRWGYRYTTAGKYLSYKCNQCGKRCQDSKNLIKSGSTKR
jgi:uncharacterized protein YprB with RNaseH-like and TPR domain